MTGRGRGAKRPRNFFFLYVSNVLGTYNLSVGYKTTKGEIQPLSSSSQSTIVKAPFGPVNYCKIIERRESIEEDPKKDFKFVNKKCQFKVMKNIPLNNLEYSLSEFSRKITQMCTENKRELLALYLSVINKSEDFIYHRQEDHDKDGFPLNGSGQATIEGIAAAGGTLDDYKDFVKLARESSMMVDSTEHSLELVSTQKRNRKNCNTTFQTTEAQQE